MSTRFWISVIVIFIVTMALGLVVHGLLLGRDYAALTPQLFRTEADQQAHFSIMVLAHVFMAIGITWLYRGGRSDRPWPGQGVRFGLALAFYAVVPIYLIYFAVQPMPAALVAKQIVMDTIAAIVIGLCAAAVNRDRLRAAVVDAEDELPTPIPR